MDIEYDEEADAAFIWLRTRPSDEEEGFIDGEVWPEELRGHIGLLFDREKKLIAVEVLCATAHLDRSLLRRRDSLRPSRLPPPDRAASPHARLSAHPAHR